MLLNTPICDFNAPMPNFVLKDAVGKSYNSQDIMGEHGLLVIFMCNHCPYVKAIIDRLVSDVNLIKNEGVNSIAIMPNDYKNYHDDSPEYMLEFAKKHAMDFPYLIDEHQEVAKAYGAVCTPDFFGYNNQGLLQYRGRLDDARMGDDTERTPELRNAMRLITQTGVGPTEQTPSMGCSIKWR